MKKLLIAIGFMFASTFAFALIAKTSKLGPTAATLSAWNNTATDASQAVTISSAAANGRNCMKKITFIATTTSTVRILDAGTTVYAVDLAANTPLYENWEDEDMCGSTASAFRIKISTAVRATTLGSQFLNYSGFTY